MGDTNLGEVVTPSELCEIMNYVSLNEIPMKKVNLSTETFDGEAFYAKYKDAIFLTRKQNIAVILTQQAKFTEQLKTMQPYEKLEVCEMFVRTGVPLYITKSETVDESDVDSHEFTYRRLMGLVAMHIWNNIDKFDTIYAMEPEALGLCWTNTMWQRRLYLSAIPGAELFESAFEYIPFICALKKYSLKKISESMLLHIASLPNSITGEPMAVWYRRRFDKSEEYTNKLFTADYSWRIKDVVYKAAPSSVQRYLLHLGAY